MRDDWSIARAATAAPAPPACGATGGAVAASATGTADTSGARSRSSRAAPPHPAPSATCAGAHPYLVVRSSAAPPLCSASITRRFPSRAATCAGVHSKLCAWSRSAPSDARAATALCLLAAAAAYTGVSPSLFAAFTSAPSSTSRCSAEHSAPSFVLKLGAQAPSCASFHKGVQPMLSRSSSAGPVAARLRHFATCPSLHARNICNCVGEGGPCTGCGTSGTSLRLLSARFDPNRADFHERSYLRNK